MRLPRRLTEPQKTILHLKIHQQPHPKHPLIPLRLPSHFDRSPKFLPLPAQIFPSHHPHNLKNKHTKIALPSPITIPTYTHISHTNSPTSTRQTYKHFKSYEPKPTDKKNLPLTPSLDWNPNNKPLHTNCTSVHRPTKSPPTRAPLPPQLQFTSFIRTLLSTNAQRVLHFLRQPSPTAIALMIAQQNP